MLVAELTRGVSQLASDAALSQALLRGEVSCDAKPVKCYHERNLSLIRFNWLFSLLCHGLQLTPMLLIECLRWSATEPRTTALLLSLARHAREFAAMGKWGKRFLQGLLRYTTVTCSLTSITRCCMSVGKR